MSMFGKYRDTQNTMKCPICAKINRFRVHNAPSYRLKCGNCGYLLSENTMVDAEAVIISCGTHQNGLQLEDCDSDLCMHYWVYEYEYRVPGTDKVRSHRDKVEFLASAFGGWFNKYHASYKFSVRYDKDYPSRHIRLDDFEIEERKEIRNKSELIKEYIKIEKKKHGIQILVLKVEWDDLHRPVHTWIVAKYFSGGASESEIKDAIHRILENRLYFSCCIRCGDYQPNDLKYKKLCQKCAEQKAKILSEKQIINNNDFTLKQSGWYGIIIYKSDDSEIEIDWKMSDIREYDILLKPMDLREWDRPNGTKIPRDQQIQILYKLRVWLREQNLKTDIELPGEPEFNYDHCIEPGCNKYRMNLNSGFCLNHLDERLLKK